MAVKWGGRGPGHMARSFVDQPVAALRVIHSRSGGQWPTHPSPPTITQGAPNAASAIPGSVVHGNGSYGKFRYLGGDWAAVGASFPDTIYWTVRTFTVTVGSSQGGVFGAIETIETGRYFEPALNGAPSGIGQQWRLIVDDMDCGILPALTGSTALYRVLIDFGTAARRKIRLEYVGGSLIAKIYEICTEASATLIPTTARDSEASVLLDFDAASYRNPAAETALGSIAVVQALATFAMTKAGVWTNFAANTARITDQGFLVEGEATNLLRKSQDFSDSSVWLRTNVNVTANAIAAPDGTTTADKLIANTVNGPHYVRQNVTVSSATDNSASIYAKAGEITRCQFQFFDGTANRFPIFDLITGAKVVDGGTGSNFRAEQLEDSWWRFSFPMTTSNTNGQIYAYLVSGTSTTFVGNNSDGAYFWQADLQPGAVIANPVPTDTTSVTRAADAATVAIPAGASGDRIEVYYGNGLRSQILRSALASPTSLNLASDGGAPWLNSYIKRIEVVTDTERLILFGDSFFGSTGVTNMADALAYKIGRQFGFSDIWLSTSGGTGWKQVGSSPFFAVDGITRFDLDITDRTPTLAILALGVNDLGDGTEASIQADLAAKLESLAAADPTCLVHVFGPYDASAPTAPAASFDDLDAAIAAACVGKGRVWFHSMKGVAYTKVDAVHADPAGHDTIYKAMFNKIAAVHGLPQVA